MGGRAGGRGGRACGCAGGRAGARAGGRARAARAQPGGRAGAPAGGRARGRAGARAGGRARGGGVYVCVFRIHYPKIERQCNAILLNPIIHSASAKRKAPRQDVGNLALKHKTLDTSGQMPPNESVLSKPLETCATVSSPSGEGLWGASLHVQVCTHRSRRDLQTVYLAGHACVTQSPSGGRATVVDVCVAPRAGAHRSRAVCEYPTACRSVGGHLRVTAWR